MSDAVDLITAVRRWAGFDLDQLCASCKRPFYCAAALPVCYGCRRRDARATIVELLTRRAAAVAAAETEPQP